MLIDEFQDANIAQIELMRLLAGAERNVFAVGDHRIDLALGHQPRHHAGKRSTTRLPHDIADT